MKCPACGHEMIRTGSIYECPSIQCDYFEEVWWDEEVKQNDSKTDD